jgi:hypothetical protein
MIYALPAIASQYIQKRNGCKLFYVRSQENRSLRVLSSDQMPKSKAVLTRTPEADNPAIDRAEFDATMKKLLAAKRPITKDQISARVKVWGPAVSRGVKRSDRR